MANQPRNREKSSQGQTLILDAKFYEYAGGNLVDDDNFSVDGSLPTVKIYNPAGTIVSDSSTSGSLQPVRINIGQYEYSHPIAVDATVSDSWKIEWSVTINDNSLVFSELFTVVASGDVTFSEGDFRVGFAFNNPDLTSTHHASLWDNTSQTVKGWGLLVSPDELRYMEGFGTKLVSPDASQTYDDNMLQYYIDTALAMVERDLNIDILPKVVRHDDPINQSDYSSSGGSLTGESNIIRTQGSRIARQDLPSESQEPNRVREPGYPYRRNQAQHYLFLKLRRRPLIDVLKAVMVDPIQNQVIDLYPWRKEFTGFDSRLQFFPNLTGIGSYPYLASNLLQVQYPFNNFPDAIFIDYRTGYLNAKDVPIELRLVVQSVAAIPFLLMLGRGKSPGLANASVNLNSISETFGTTQSATSTLYGADIITIQKWLKDWWTRNAHKYRRDTIGVL